MRFQPSIVPLASESGKQPWWFVFSGVKLWVETSGTGFTVPRYSDFQGLNGSTIYLGEYRGISCLAAQSGGQAPAGLEPVALRTLHGQMDKELWRIAGMAYQLLNWETKRRFCGHCGNPTADKTDERAKKCPQCSTVEFPSMSPAVIVAVVKGDRLLLARSSRFPNSKMYSVIAGYHEPGETLEECVAREVGEEVGIEIKNIRYFGSQPWPFSSSLMVAFTAEYAGGEVQPDNVEILDAGWYSADNLPEVPKGGSIAKDLVDWFVRTYGEKLPTRK